MIKANLLHKAYLHIDAGDLPSAHKILDLLISVEPMNVEAWEAYMQICGTCDELDRLCERVLQIAEINRIDRKSILDYYYFLRQKIRYCDLESEFQNNVTLELVDQFNLNLQDQASVSINFGGHASLRHWFVWVLGKAIVIPYIILLAMGLNLLLAGNNFGYWILLIPFLRGFANVRKIIIPVFEVSPNPNGYQIIFPRIANEKNSCCPELLP